MPIFRITRNYSYGLETHIEANSIDEAKQFFEEHSKDIEWERAYDENDHLDKEIWDVYNEEDEDYRSIED